MRLPFEFAIVNRNGVTQYATSGYQTIEKTNNNTTTFVGQKQAGVWGGIFATLGVVFPSLVIIMIIAAFIQNFAHLPAVQNAFAGIRVCVCVLILNAVVKLWKKSVVDWKTFLIFLLVFAGSVFLNVSPVLYVLAAALAGIVIKELEARKA